MPQVTPKVRRPTAGQIAIVQTHDRQAVAALLTAAGMTAAGVEWPGACYLIAQRDRVPLGVVGVETQVAAALLRSLTVVESTRRQGIGGRLMQAARVAAHTRGARRLFALPDRAAADYFMGFGFQPVAESELHSTLDATFMVEYLRAHAEFPRGIPLMLDISQDGVILR